jgi:hypothetical protein
MFPRLNAHEGAPALRKGSARLEANFADDVSAAATPSAQTHTPSAKIFQGGRIFD